MPKGTTRVYPDRVSDAAAGAGDGLDYSGFATNATTSPSGSTVMLPG